MGVIKSGQELDGSKVEVFEDKIHEFRLAGQWSKGEIVELFKFMLPDFYHKGALKYLLTTRCS